MAPPEDCEPARLSNLGQLTTPTGLGAWRELRDPDTGIGLSLPHSVQITVVGSDDDRRAEYADYRPDPEVTLRVVVGAIPAGRAPPSEDDQAQVVGSYITWAEGRSDATAEVVDFHRVRLDTFRGVASELEFRLKTGDLCLTRLEVLTSDHATVAIQVTMRAGKASSVKAIRARRNALFERIANSVVLTAETGG